MSMLVSCREHHGSVMLVKSWYRCVVMNIVLYACLLKLQIEDTL